MKHDFYNPLPKVDELAKVEAQGRAEYAKAKLEAQCLAGQSLPIEEAPIRAKAVEAIGHLEEAQTLVDELFSALSGNKETGATNGAPVPAAVGLDYMMRVIGTQSALLVGQLKTILSRL